MRRRFFLRFPKVIWFRWSQSERILNHEGDDNPSTRHAHKPLRPFFPRRFPWTSLVFYLSILGVTSTIFLGLPAKKGGMLPVSGHIGIPTKRSWLSITLNRWHATPGTFLNWIDLGLPLLKLSTRHRGSFHAHVRSVIMMALTDISGVELNSLQKILQIEIPSLSLVPSARSDKTSSSGPPTRHKSARLAVNPTLPGDGGRIWAQLGQHPLVGIYQTHSREAFWPVLPKNSSAAYSTDWSKTVVQVGWWLAEDLQGLGIPVIQSRVDNMSHGLLASYSESYNTAKDLLKWYPSVHIILDIHRSDKSFNTTTAVVHGIKTARILLVVGSNKLLPNPYGQQNLTFAKHMAYDLRQISPKILRGNGIDQVPYRYNQQLAPGDVLIEIGGVHNTLAQERNAVNDLAQAISRIVKNHQYP